MPFSCVDEPKPVRPINDFPLKHGITMNNKKRTREELDKASRMNNREHRRQSKRPKKANKKYKDSPRTPRPLGVTLLTREYNNTKDPKLLKQIQRIWISQWLANGFEILGKPRTTEELQRILGCRGEMIAQHLNEPMRMLGKDGLQKFEAALGFIFLGASSDRQKIQGQVNLLIESQGSGYKAFISDAVLKGLSLLNENTKTFMAIAKELKPEKPKIQVNTLVTNPEGDKTVTEETQKWVGPNEAVKILEANRQSGLHLLEDPGAQEALFAKHLRPEANTLDSGLEGESLLKTESLPEVIATKQQGLSIDGHLPVLKKVKKPHGDRNGQEFIFSSPVILPV